MKDSTEVPTQGLLEPPHFVARIEQSARERLRLRSSSVSPLPLLREMLPYGERKKVAAVDWFGRAFQGALP